MSEFFATKNDEKSFFEGRFFENKKSTLFYLFAVGKSDLSYLHNEASKFPKGARLIGWVLSGSGSAECCGEKTPIYPQDVFILSANRDNKISENPKNPLTILWMAVGGAYVDSVFELFSLNDSFHFSNVIISYNIEAIMRQSSAFVDEDEFFGHSSVHFMDIAQKLYIYNKKKKKEQKTLSAPERMKEIIDASDSYDFSMTELAEKVFCSRNHAIRLFKARYGVSPYKYISDARLKHAEKLLKSTNLSIAEISKKLSFCDSRYFSNWFRTQKNLSPKEYRKTSGEG